VKRANVSGRSEADEPEELFMSVRLDPVPGAPEKVDVHIYEYIESKNTIGSTAGSSGEMTPGGLNIRLQYRASLEDTPNLSGGLDLLLLKYPFDC